MLYTFPSTAADPKKLRPWTGQHLKKVFLDKNCSVLCLFCNRIICMGRSRRKELPEGEKNKNEFFFCWENCTFFKSMMRGLSKEFFISNVSVPLSWSLPPSNHEGFYYSHLIQSSPSHTDQDQSLHSP